MTMADSESNSVPPRRAVPLPSPARSRSDSADAKSTRDVGVVIVAGGSGARTGSSELKQFRWVAGKPALLHSVQAFMARSDAVRTLVTPSIHLDCQLRCGTVEVQDVGADRMLTAKLQSRQSFAAQTGP